MKSLPWLSLGFLVLLTACNPQSGVNVLTGGIKATFLYEIEGQEASGKTLDMGEHVLSYGPRMLKVKINNASKYPYTNINLVFSTSDDNLTAITYSPNEEGKMDFPGHGGTCQTTLAPGSNCEIRLQFSPRETRKFSEIVTLNFKNYLDPETHIATLKFLAGNPASLAFTNDITQYNFGNIVNNTAVVERAEDTVYTQTLEVINAGGLYAKNFKVSLKETCTAIITNGTAACPDSIKGSYQIENLCPAALEPQKKCEVKVRYKPKNQDPVSGIVPETIKEVKYRAEIIYAYTSDPMGTEAALNAYFNSLSTNIEARFKVSSSTVTLENQVVSGNREARTIKINNLGYREGEIRSLVFKNIDDSLMAICKAKESSDYLNCVNASDVSLPLSTFPFSIKDKNACLTAGAEQAKFIPVGSGCIFDITFQPSVTFITNMDVEFQNIQTLVRYDSRWLAVEHIKDNKIFVLSAKSKSAGRLVLERIIYEGNTYVPTNTNPALSDLGKLTLQSPNYFKRKSMVLSYKNIGNVAATNLVFKDGANKAIPIGGTGVNLGATSPYFYSGAIGTDSTCGIVNPGETCSLNISFAPIGMTTNAQEDANMFDVVDANGKYKAFFLTYDTGALYTDDNIDTVANYPAQTIESRTTAILLRKGLLQRLDEDTRNVTPLGLGANVPGDTAIYHMYLRNVGTGPITYIRLLNPPSTLAPNAAANGYNFNHQIQTIPIGEVAGLGADYDCSTLVDYSLDYSVPSSAHPSTRTGNFVQLPKEKSCVFRVQALRHAKYKARNATTCTTTLPTVTVVEEYGRFFSREAQAAGGMGLWEYCYNSSNDNTWSSIAFDWYDGDTSNPLLPFGTKVSHPTWLLNIIESWPAKLFPVSPDPILTATLYRPSYAQPTLPTGQLGMTFPEQYFYGISPTYYTLPDVQASPFMQGDDSRATVPSLTAYGNRANYDYILYLGTFPQGMGNILFPFSIMNLGGIASKVRTFTTTGDAQFTIQTMPTFPMTIPKSALMPSIPTFNLSTATPGEFHMEVDYVYEPGLHNQPLVFKSTSQAGNLASTTKATVSQKVMVVGKVLATSAHPKLTLGVQDYDVTQNNSAPPTVTIGSEYAQNMSWNTIVPTDAMTFDVIKLTTSTATANDVYAQKKLIFKNLTSYPLYDLKFASRATSTATVLKTISTNFKQISGPTYTTCVSGMTLTAGQSCIITYRYQPLSGDTTDDSVFTAVYRFAPGQYVMQNINLKLFPRSPGALIASNYTAESINYKATSTSSNVTRTSYALNFGTVNLDVVPKTIAFNSPLTTGLKRIQFKNTQDTKLSLLLSYQKYLASNSLRGYTPASIVPNTLIPDPTEYTNIDGYDYTKIYNSKYPNGEVRQELLASKGCFFGDDETNVAILAHQKGFSKTTINPCYAILNFNANFEYLLRTVAFNNGDDMRDNAFELWYYSVFRSSTASIWLHTKGIINPDESTHTGAYASVQAFEDRTTSFTLPLLYPKAAGVGSVIGYRVLIGSSAAALTTPYTTSLAYKDFPYSASSQLATFTTGLLNANYFYFRIVAIRYDSRFISTGRFTGLTAGKYLSLSSTIPTPLKVLIPPVNHYYFHDAKLIVEKQLYNNENKRYTYPVALSKCTSRSAALKDPSAVNRNYTLINSTAWALLQTTPGATNYSGMNEVSHWTSDAPVTIVSQCGTLPGYSASTTYQAFESYKKSYIRDGSAPNGLVNIIKGGVVSTPYSNFTSYVTPAIEWATSRCMATLP